MKNLLIIILAAASIAAGAFCIFERNQLRAQSAQLTQAQTRVGALETQLSQQSDAVEQSETAEAKAKFFQQVLTQVSSNAVEQSKQTEELRQSLVTAKTNGPMQGLTAIFKNPEMRKMIESQQKMVMGPMIAKQYAALIQQINLTPDQADALKTLLQNKTLASTSAGMSLMDSSLDASQRDSLAAQIKSANQDFDNQIQQLLGDQNYQAYQAYTKTIPARTTVGQWSDQLAGTPNALGVDQEQQLIQAMTDANSNYKWTSVLNQQKSQGGNQTDPAGAFNNLTEDNINQAAQEEAQFDEQFFATAQQILTPAQAAAFQQFQINMRQMQTSAMKMAAQMMPHSNP